MGSFSMTPDALKRSAIHGRIVARAMEIDPGAWKGIKTMTFMPEQQARQMQSMNKAALEIVQADEQLTQDTQKGITHP